MAQNKALDYAQGIAKEASSSQGGTNSDLNSTSGPRVPQQHPDPKTDGTGCCKKSDMDD